MVHTEQIGEHPLIRMLMGTFHAVDGAYHAVDGAYHAVDGAYHA
jgi:hypothetical protein